MRCCLQPLLPVSPLALGQHRLHFLNKIAYILECPVHRGEANVGHLVEHFQALHDQLTQGSHGDLAEVVGVNFALNMADDRFDLLAADGPLVAGFLQAGAELGHIEWLARFILLDDFKRYVFDLFDGPNAALTAVAMPPTADREPG